MQRTLDCRGLHPPEPLVRILAELDTLKDSDVLEAWLDRRPLMLFPELAERSLAYRCDQHPGGAYIVRISAREEELITAHDA
ncbi:MAG: DUF2249 domain-containing protein [Vulcanimicrobiaceae bacterium]